MSLEGGVVWSAPANAYVEDARMRNPRSREIE
jgi:hypothetical protein